MKYCKNCGTQLSDEETSCPNCGASYEEQKEVKVNADANYKFCARCGNRTLKEAVVCPNCGCAFPNVRQPVDQKELANQTPGKATAGLVLGIIGLAMAVFGSCGFVYIGFFTFIGLGLNIPGLILSISSRCNAGKKVPGIILNAIGLAINAIVAICYIIVVLLAIAIVSSSGSTGTY